MNGSNPKPHDRSTRAEKTEPPVNPSLAVWEDEGGSNGLDVTPKTSDHNESTQLENSQLSATNSLDDDATPGDATLPYEMSHRFTKPLGRFLKIEAATGIILFFATCVALVLSNSAWSDEFLKFWEIPVGIQIGSFDFGRSLRHWINDGLMTLFFFVVALELKREIVLGELRGWRKAALPFAGALGGMVVPASIYLALMVNKPGLHGWGTVMATDTAFVIGCLALLGSRIPPILRLFLLSLAIFDDIGAILVVAFGYGDALAWSALAVAALSLVSVYATARVGIRSIPIYCLLGGIVWLAFDASGIVIV